MATLITEESMKNHKHPMSVKWETELYDEDMNFIERKSGENSLVAGMAFMIYTLLTYVDATTEHDITNALRIGYSMYPGTANWNGFDTVGTFDDQLKGIVLGTNNTPVTADDYKLNTIINVGAGAGCLRYYVQTNSACVTDATTCSFMMSRFFRNDTANPVVVKELGIYGMQTVYTWCLCRDIIGDPGTSIAAGQYMLVKYTITVTEA